MKAVKAAAVNRIFAVQSFIRSYENEEHAC